MAIGSNTSSLLQTLESLYILGADFLKRNTTTLDKSNRELIWAPPARRHLNDDEDNNKTSVQLGKPGYGTGEKHIQPNPGKGAELHKFRQEDLTIKKDIHLLQDITNMINLIYKLFLMLSHVAKEAQDSIDKLSQNALKYKRLGEK